MAKCIYPITIGDKEGKQHKWKVVPCGKCIACKNRRQTQWAFRLGMELRRSTSAVFLTLTYSDECLPFGDENPTLDKRDTQKFMKRLRKAQSKLTNDKIKYYGCGEYGTKTFRPHYHYILFNLHPSLMLDGPIRDIWRLGIAQIDECNVKSINYVTKYIMKPRYPVQGSEPEFAMMSKRLGDNYVTSEKKNGIMQISLRI